MTIIIIEKISLLIAFVLGGLIFRAGYKYGFYRSEYSLPDKPTSDKPNKKKKIEPEIDWEHGI